MYVCVFVALFPDPLTGPVHKTVLHAHFYYFIAFLRIRFAIAVFDSFLSARHISISLQYPCPSLPSPTIYLVYLCASLRQIRACL